MPVIPQSIRERIAQHLGYSRPRGVNPTLLQIFNQNCNSILSNSDIYGTTGQSVVNLLERCDDAFLATNYRSEQAFTQFQQVLGDVNRRTRTLTLREFINEAKELYLMACDDLAVFINVPNLQRPEVVKEHFHRLGDTFVQVSPNIPDTCITDRVILSGYLC